MDLNVDLRACLSGRKDAWDAFVRASAPVIYAAVHRSMRSRGSTHQADIDDRVQDVYVRLLREDSRLLREFDPNRASLATWISLIARTVVHEHFQKKRLPTAAIEHSETGAAAAPPRSIRHDLPPVSLDGLTPQQRQVLQMLFEESLTVEQAAARLDVDPQTIRSAKHKALTRLREAMFGPEPESRTSADVAPPHPLTPSPPHSGRPVPRGKGP